MNSSISMAFANLALPQVVTLGLVPHRFLGVHGKTETQTSMDRRNKSGNDGSGSLREDAFDGQGSILVRP